jgi:hypothetical protein
MLFDISLMLSIKIKDFEVDASQSIQTVPSHPLYIVVSAVSTGKEKPATIIAHHPMRFFPHHELRRNKVNA